jgi:hypothetical protein
MQKYEMDLPSGIVWQITRIYSDSLFFQGVILRLLRLLSLVLTGINWWRVRCCGISFCPTEAREGYRTTSLQLRLVRRQSLAPTTITHLHVLCCNDGIFCFILGTANSRVSTLHLVSGIFPLPRSPTSVGTVRTANWRHSAEHPRVTYCELIEITGQTVAALI